MLDVCKPTAATPRDGVLAALVEHAPQADGLDGRCRAVLARIVASPLAYVPAEPPSARAKKSLRALFGAMKLTRADVATFLAGLAPTHGLDDLAAIEDSGWVACWVVDGLIGVTMTAFAAAHVGVTLSEGDWDADESRWAPRDPRPNPIHCRTARGCRKGDGWLEAVADPKPGPLQAAIEAEEFLVREKLSAGGEPVRDELTGEISLERITLFGKDIPRARPRSKVSKKKKKRPKKAKAVA
jgi:hypothetical protein